MTGKFFQHAGVTLALTTMLAAASIASHGQAPSATSMVQVPIATTYVGVPAANYSTATPGASCPSTTPGYLSANNGCPASQTTLYYTYSMGIDSSNDMAIANVGSGQNSSSGISLVYQGGAAIGAALVAALPGYTFTPMVGHVYQLSNGGQLKLNGTQYYCTGSTIGTVAQDQWGNGCPAEYSAAQSRSVTMDAQGNMFFGQTYASTTDYQGLRVIYVGGTAAANLITNYFNAHCSTWPIGITASVVTTGNVCAANFTPKVGSVYSLSAPNDFIAIRGIGIQVNPTTGAETIYANDNGALTAETGLQAATSGNQMKIFTGTGWATYIQGNVTGGASVTQGDGNPAAQAFVDLPTYMTWDPNGNLYFLDSTDARIRVVYNGGATPPLYIQGATPQAVATPQVGYVYTVAGGGTSRVSPSPAISLSLSPVALGLDAQGNLYFTDSQKETWVEYAATSANTVAGTAVAISGGAASTATGSVSTAPVAGLACNGSTSPISGPVMLDAYADGCPGTEVAPINGIGTIVFDSQGNFYMAEARVVTGATAIVRKYSYNTQFGSVATGSTATNLLAFAPCTQTNTFTPAAQYSITGGTTNEFVDAGSDVCSPITTPNKIDTCTFNVTFAPAKAGTLMGAITLTGGGSTAVSFPLSGIGSGAQIALDPATQTTIGTGLSLTGVGVDQAGNAYLGDGTTGSIFVSVAGGAPAVYATGFNKPAQIAKTGSGTLFVADTGNNRVAVVTPGNPVTVASLSTLALSKPSGVAVDAQGDLFIADTGNNRVLEVAYDLGTYGKTTTMGFTGLNAPIGLAVDFAGDVFVADSGNARVVELSAAGVQSVISMSPAAAHPVAVAVDPAGDLFVADSTNQTVSMVPYGSTTATTLRGGLTGLTELAADNFGDLYIAATSLAGVLTLNRSQITITYPQINIGSTNTQTFTLLNSGNQSLSYGSSLFSSTDTVDFSVTPATTNGCSAGTALGVGASCGLAALFQPESVSQALTDVVSFPTSNAAGASKATLTGQGQMGLSYSFGAPGSLPNTINTTLTATLATPAPGTPINGTVTFTLGGTSTTVPVTGGTAVLTLPLTAGVYTVVATYNGTTYPGSVTATVTMTVVTGTSSVALAVTAPTGAITYGQAVTVTATTTTGNSTKTPGGTVTFTVNNVVQTPITFAAAVSYTFSPPAGSYNVCAAYSGDANYVPSQNCLVVTVGKATPSLSLVATPVVGGTNTIALKASLLAAPTYPTGNVAFSYGSTGLGSVALISGNASLTTTTNILTSYTFTAAYGGDANFLPTTFSVTVSPVLVLSATPSSLTMLQNSVGQTTLALNSFYGYGAANVTFSCTGLPLYTTCAANPTAAPVNQITSVPVQFFTDVSPLAVQSKLENTRGVVAVTVAGLLLVWVIPNKRRKRWASLAILAVAALGSLAIAGCSSSSTSGNPYITPTGTYTIGIVASDGTTKYSLPFILTVTPGYLTGRPN